jgi:hypothetical protein
MNIQDFATTPQLIEVILDTEDIITNHGEPITFWTYDIVSMSVYFDFFNARTNSQFEQLGLLIKKMILNEKGEQVLTTGKDLPIDILTAAIIKLGDILGKSLAPKSTSKTGKARK